MSLPAALYAIIYIHVRTHFRGTSTSSIISLRPSNTIVFLIVALLAQPVMSCTDSIYMESVYLQFIVFNYLIWNLIACAC